MATVNVMVEVEVDISQIDTEDLIQELSDRNCATASNARQDMFRALSNGDNDKALSLLRDYLCDCLGRVI